MDYKEFTLAGKAIFTLCSTKLDKRITYKVVRDHTHNSRYFVRYLYGPENTSDYRYIGFFYSDTLSFRRGISLGDYRADAHSMFAYYLDVLAGRREWPETMQFFPSGRCGRCGRLLTTPESIERGLGPECATR